MSASLVILAACWVTFGMATTRLWTVFDAEQDNIKAAFGRGLKVAETRHNERFDQIPTTYARRLNEDSRSSGCQALAQGVNGIVDLTAGGYKFARDMARKQGILYLHVDASVRPFVQVADEYLQIRDALDATFIFETDAQKNQSLYYLVGRSSLRFLLLHQLNTPSIEVLKQMRPPPSFYVTVADTELTGLILHQMSGNADVIKPRPGTWTLVFTDFRYAELGRATIPDYATLIEMSKQNCCQYKTQQICTCRGEVIEEFVENSAILLAQATQELRQQSGIELATSVDKCQEEEGEDGASDMQATFNKKFTEVVTTSNGHDYKYDEAMETLLPRISFDISIFVNKTKQKIGSWTPDKGLNIEVDPPKVRRLFRVGLAQHSPWLMKHANGSWIGYCYEFLQRLSELMDFDYDLDVADPNESLGVRGSDGSWTGLVGKLARGDLDIVIADLTMTAERDEVIDYVAPYFAKSGISIVIRQPVKNESLFKFMTVLKIEVWMIILAAVVVTAILLCVLDTYSPFSAQNNEEKFPGARRFNLKESFWFALTSFTPQGGGEVPKALSGRTLVAAYWLFVVLMLATFTANLAAFLTVERMQTTVQSLEELSRQSKINYSVVNNSWTHKYFINMAHAEDELFRMWKELTLTTAVDEGLYRVWDYPIKESYKGILETIQASNPVQSYQEGIKRVIDDENGFFAFIDDTALLSYDLIQNCNLTEVGKSFAEQPYAIAVQQGSFLQQNISHQILELQKERYFELLKSKYWNITLRNQCAKGSDGITLQSLGGVFIITVIGLAVAMVALVIEIQLSKRHKSRNKVHADAVMNQQVASTVARLHEMIQNRGAAAGGAGGRGLDQRRQDFQGTSWHKHFLGLEDL